MWQPSQPSQLPPRGALCITSPPTQPGGIHVLPDSPLAQLAAAVARGGALVVGDLGERYHLQGAARVTGRAGAVVGSGAEELVQSGPESACGIHAACGRRARGVRAECIRRSRDVHAPCSTRAVHAERAYSAHGAHTHRARHASTVRPHVRRLRSLGLLQLWPLVEADKHHRGALAARCGHHLLDSGSCKGKGDPCMATRRHSTQRPLRAACTARCTARCTRMLHRVARLRRRCPPSSASMSWRAS